MDKLSFEQLREANAPRVERFGHKLNEWTETQWSNAMAGEAGEVCNVTKKRSRAKGMNEQLGKTTPTTNDLALEIADVIIYADLLAASAGIDLGLAVRTKFNIVSAKLAPEAPGLPFFEPQITMTMKAYQDLQSAAGHYSNKPTTRIPTERLVELEAIETRNTARDPNNVTMDRYRYSELLGKEAALQRILDAIGYQ